ncbi:MAG: hypothetical protein EA353_09035 [Puniceicoccaceae bacterium]|nr:MAG: hypothetical protein EA353_09035 [Puniceicoccaceae bacterium]
MARGGYTSDEGCGDWKRLRDRCRLSGAGSLSRTGACLCGEARQGGAVRSHLGPRKMILMGKLSMWKSRVGFNYCDTRYPGIRSDLGSSEIAGLHRVYLDTVEREQGKLSRPTALMASIFFLGYSLREAWNYLRSHGHACRRDSGKALWRQFYESSVGQFCYQVPVMDYYANRLYRYNSVQERSGFICQRILHKLILRLNTDTQTEVKPHVEKQVFEKACRAQGLPCVPTFAMLEAGKLNRNDVLKAWVSQGRSFLIKPDKAYGGIRVAIFDRAENGCWRERLTGRWVCDAGEQPCDQLAQFAPEGSYLVQPLMHNAPWLKPFSNGNLCNYRIVTGLNRNGGIETLCAFLRMPCGQAVLTSIESDAACSAIDLNRGTLSSFGFMDIRKAIMQVHPDGGARVEGHRIHNWTEVLALAERAHQALGGACFVGWDIVDTKEKGLLLLESNLLWGANLAQFNGQPLLGSTAFPELYRAHLEWQETSQ